MVRPITAAVKGSRRRAMNQSPVGCNIGEMAISTLPMPSSTCGKAYQMNSNCTRRGIPRITST